MLELGTDTPAKSLQLPACKPSIGRCGGIWVHLWAIRRFKKLPNTPMNPTCLEVVLQVGRVVAAVQV